MSPVIDLRMAIDANMTFWHWYEINGGWNDGGWVEVSDDFGQTWTRIDPVGGYPDNDGWYNLPCYAGTTPGWVQAEFDLSAYAGELIFVQLHLFDVWWDGPTEGPGWYIDDVNISATYTLYGITLNPDWDIAISPDGTAIYYLMTATNIGTVGPDTFDLSSFSILGWPVAFYDLGMNPITSIGPIATGSSMDFFVEVTIPGGAPPGTEETTGVTAISQNDPSFPPAEDTSGLSTQVITPILYVDDDGGIDTENEFEGALTSGGYAYNIWDYQLFGAPDLADLQQHELVIWATGNDWMDASLLPIDRVNLGNYLDGGGKLYFSSLFAGLDASNMFGGTDAWLPWYQTYLHSDIFNVLGAPTTINGVPGDPIGDGLNYNIFSGDYNFNLMPWFTDISPVNNGITFFTEPFPANVAIRADTGVYRVVHTSFDLASVDGATNRTILLNLIIQWLLLGDIPYIVETIPMDGASGIAENQNIIIIYSESMDSGVTPTLNQVGGPDPGGWTFSGWSTTYVTDDTATWSHSNWASGQSVNMSVSGGQDLEANSASGLLWNFSIIVALPPWATATGPISVGTNDTLPTITYNFGNGPTSVEIYWSDNGGTSWNLWGTDATVDGSWTPGGPLPASGTYTWSARAIGTPSEPVPSGAGSIEGGTYVLDMDAPFISSTTPLDLATGISTTPGTYVIQFNEPMSPVGTPATDLPGISWLWDPSGLWLNGTYNALSTGVTYYVDLTAQGFMDSVGNLLTGDTYKNFTTVLAANSATATGPLSGPTNVAGITITYIDVGSPATVDLYYTTDVSSPYTWTLAGTDASVDGSYPWTVPADGAYGWCAVSPDESAPLSSDAPEASSYDYDGTQPQVSSTDPIDTQTGVAVDLDVMITFNDVMETGTFTYTVEPNPGGLSPAWSGGDTIVTIFHSNFAIGTRYWVNITGITDDAGNDLDVLPYSFYFDTVNTATATGPISGPTNVAGVTITYLMTGSPATVDLYYTTDTSSPYTWTPVGTDNPADGNYGWTVPADGMYGWFAQSPDESAPAGTDAPEAFAYIYDGTQPQVSSTNPPNAATGIAVNQDVIINFDEIMTVGTFTYTIEPALGGLSEQGPDTG
jgi:hypothetical protein